MSRSTPDSHYWQPSWDWLRLLLVIVVGSGVFVHNALTFIGWLLATLGLLKFVAWVSHPQPNPAHEDE